MHTNGGTKSYNDPALFLIPDRRMPNHNISVADLRLRTLTRVRTSYLVNASLDAGRPLGRELTARVHRLLFASEAAGLRHQFTYERVELCLEECG